MWSLDHQRTFLRDSSAAAPRGSYASCGSSHSSQRMTEAYAREPSAANLVSFGGARLGTLGVDELA